MNKIDFAYADSAHPVRADLCEAHARAWARLAGPGSWWTGEQRVEIAKATRDAQHCGTCARSLKALGPLALTEHHEAQPGQLDAAEIAVVHRVCRDANRLSRSAVDGICKNIMSVGQYVELVGVVATVLAVDAFADFMQLERRALPVPAAGAPDQIVPQGLDSELAWVPTIAPALATGAEADIYAMQSAANIHRALTYVPREKRGFFDLDDVMYLPDAALRDFSREYREIDHRQIELIAARVSALNQCHY